jgi:hypothetical protein
MLVSIAMVGSFPKHSKFELVDFGSSIRYASSFLICQLVILSCKPTVGRRDLLDPFGI